MRLSVRWWAVRILRGSWWLGLLLFFILQSFPLAHSPPPSPFHGNARIPQLPLPQPLPRMQKTQLCYLFLSSNGDWGHVFKFSVNQKLESITRKITLKLVRLTSLRLVLSVDYNHVEGFRKSEEIEALYGFGGRNVRIRDICMEFGRPFTGHILVTTQ